MPACPWRDERRPGPTLGHRCDCAAAVVRLSRPQAGNRSRGLRWVAPMTAQALQARFRQRHEAVLGALTAMHMDHLASRIDIGDLQILALPAAADHRRRRWRGRRGCGQCARARGWRALPRRTKWRAAAFRSSARSRSSGCQSRCKNLDEEEAYPAIANPHRVGGPAIAFLRWRKYACSSASEIASGALCRGTRTACATRGYRPPGYARPSR